MLLRRRICDKGASIIEVLAVLAVIGILSMGMLAGYNHVMGKFNTSKIVTNAQAMMKNLSTYFSSFRIYPAMTARQLFDLGFIDGDTFDQETNQAVHPFEGEITFAIQNGGLRYSITYHGLPGNICVAMAMMDIPVTNLFSIQIGNHAARHYPEPGVVYNQNIHLPYVMTEAGDECDADEEDGNDIEFVFM